MVTQAKKPRPRKKKEHAEAPHEEAVMKAAPASVEPEAEEDDAPMPKSYQNEAPESSDEPDFGLGIGELLRSDVSIRKAEQSADPGRSSANGKRLSIDAILKGETANAAIPAAAATEDLLPTAEEEAMLQEAADRAAEESEHFDAPAQRGGWLKTLLMILLLLALFAVAAGGVYMFLSKNGMPSFGMFGGAGTADDMNTNGATAVEPEPTVKAPDSVSVTVLVGTKAPETEGSKPFLVSRTVESEGRTNGTFSATGQASSKTDRSVGTVTITNTTSRGYTFVATTRLLSKEGVLFRLKASTVIPPNGSVDAAVAADQPGAEGDIGPSTFTVPGLSAEQQKLITGVSAAAMTGGAGTGTKGVSKEDIDAAKATLTDKLKADALDNFKVMLAEGELINADMVTSKELNVTAPKIGTAGETFPLTLSLQFRALLMPEKDVLPLLNKALNESMPSGLSTADYGLGSPHYTVQAYDTAAGTAEIRVDSPIIRR